MNKFFAELSEQPAALENTLNYYLSDEGIGLLNELKVRIDSNQFENIIFTGMGSSFFTSYAATNLFVGLGINSFVINTSELLHYQMNILNKKTLLICFSQSGESFEIKHLLDILPSSVFSVGITNNCQSTLAEKSDLTLLSKAGLEEMTSTKTFVSITLLSFILGWYIAGVWDKTKEESVCRLIDSFKSSLLDYDTAVNKMLNFLGDLKALQIIARGVNFSSASQCALMFKEANKVPAASYLGGEFRHGPMEMVESGFRAILFAAKGKTFSQSINMAEDIARFGGKVLLLTNDCQELSHDNIYHVFIDQQDEYMFSIQSMLPVQLIVDAYAKERGFEAGRFSRGAKVTVVE